MFQSAPPVKGATAGAFRYMTYAMFQSAPPVKGATPEQQNAPRKVDVSIRAPREGGDLKANPLMLEKTSFNPRPP